MTAPSAHVDSPSDGKATPGVESLSAAAVPHLHAHAKPSRKLAQILSTDAGDVRLIWLFAAAVGVLNLASPIAVEALVNSVAFGGLLQPVVVLSLILAACLLLSAAMSALQFYVTELIQRRLFVRWYERLLESFPAALKQVWDEQNAGTAANRFFEITSIQKLVSVLLLDGIAIVLTAAIGMIVLAFYHPALLAFDVIFLLAIFLLLIAGARAGPRSAIAESVAKHAGAAWLEQVAREHRSFRSRSGGALAGAVGRALTLRYLLARSAHFRVVFRQLIWGLALQVAAVVAMLGLGGWLVLVGQMTLGQLVAAELIVAAVTGSVAKLGKYLESYYDLLASIDKLAPFDELPREASGDETPAGSPAGVDVRIRDLTLNNVVGRTVFSDWRCTAAPGESVAFLAAEGRGKSLLARSLTADHRPTAGSIEIDGVDVRQWNLAELRERVCVVDGEGLWEGTIEDNVVAGRPEISGDGVRAALAAVGLSEAIRLLPQGLDTVVHAGGTPLSRGQTERLLLARALAGRPRLLVLDAVLDAWTSAERTAIWRTIRGDYPSTVLLLTKHSEVARLCERTSAGDDGSANEEEA